MSVIHPITPTAADSKTSDAFSATQKVTAFKGLEQFFAKLLLEEMRKSVPKDGLFGDDFATRMQQEMFDDTLSSAIADTGQLGIAKMLDEQMRMAEIAKKLHANPLAHSTSPPLTTADDFSTGQHMPIMGL